MSEIEYAGVEPEYDDNGELIEYYAPRPNKSQIKRDISVIAKLAEELTHLTESQLMAMEMPEKIETAIAAAKKMPATKSARKRQLKYITAQLRAIDLENIVESLARIKTKSAHGVREHHQAEIWRDKLIACDSNGVLTELLDQFPAAERQHLRQLQRNAQKEKKLQKPAKSARILYKYLIELIHGN